MNKELGTPVFLDKNTVALRFTAPNLEMRFRDIKTAPSIEGLGRFTSLYIRGISRAEGDVIVRIDNDGRFVYGSRKRKRGGGSNRAGDGQYPVEVLEEMSFVIGKAYQYGPMQAIKELVVQLDDEIETPQFASIPFNPIASDLEDYAELLLSVEGMRQAALAHGAVFRDYGNGLERVNPKLNTG